MGPSSPGGAIKRTIFLVCALASSLAGCVRQPIYHESWAGQLHAATDRCPDIDGTYRNAGEAYEKDGRAGLSKHELSLAHLLNGGWGMDEHVADGRFGITTYEAHTDPFRNIRLRLVGDRLQVHGTRFDGSTDSFELPVKTPCRDSLLRVESTWGYALLYASASRGSYSLGRAQDGSLLAYCKAGGVVLGALWGATSFWVRFPAEDSAPAPAPATGP